MQIRIPRKLKKQLKKFPQEWQKFVEERKEFLKREKHLDTIFEGDYSNGKKILRKMFKKW